jgi:hypothetical protein
MFGAIALVLMFVACMAEWSPAMGLILLAVVTVYVALYMLLRSFISANRKVNEILEDI